MTRTPTPISVIVPTWKDDLDGAYHLARLHQHPQIEVIIVDAKQVGRANRAFQMNLGAEQARGELLVFLHADTHIQVDDLLRLESLFTENPDYVGGAFRFALDQEHWRARIINFGVRLREWAFRLPYGDQAIFIRHGVFDAIGGYQESELLEDVLLIDAMKKKGKLLFYDAKAITSARCWEEHGYLKTTLANWGTMLLWRMGLSPERLKQFRAGVLAPGNKYDSLPLSK